MPSAHLKTLLSCLLFFLVVIVYLPSGECGYIWDDDQYPIKAQELGSLDGLKKIWFEIKATTQYYPLVFTSFWLENFFWGTDPLGYHLTNILLHAFASVLAFHVFQYLRVPGAFLTAVIFSIHPVHVESVTWITERKNVLSAFFYLSAFLFYLKYELAATKESKLLKYYWLSLLFYFCALLSKTVTCSLPAALVLVLWWKKGFQWRFLRPLILFFILGLGFGLITIWMEANSVAAMGHEWDLSFVERCLIAGRVILFYISKLLVPVELTFIYPRWEIDTSNLLHYSFPMISLGLMFFFWRMRFLWGKGPLVAYLFFVGTLFPALGFFDVYPMRYSFVADHFQYLASLSMIALAVSFGMKLFEKSGRRKLKNMLCVSTVFLLSLLTWNQQGQYLDSETLWRKTIEKNPLCWMAYNNLGFILKKQGKEKQAELHFRQALRVNPDSIAALNHLSLQLITRGQYEEAAEHLKHAIQVHDRDKKFRARVNLFYKDTLVVMGELFKSQGEYNKAIQVYQSVLRYKPDDAIVHLNLGMVLLHEEKLNQSLDHFKQALVINQNLSTAYFGIASVLKAQGDLSGAVLNLNEAFRNGLDSAVALKAKKMMDSIKKRKIEK